MEFGTAGGLFTVDPRTKLILVLMGSVSVFAMSSPTLEIVLVVAILLLALSQGMYRFALRASIGYALVLLVSFIGFTYASGQIQIVLVASILFLRKFFPTVMLGYVLIATTKVNELISALSRLRVPRSIVIPFAVMLRYFPVVIENWGYIKDAMRLRGLSPSLWGFIRNPAMTLECIYVPMLMSASSISDDLARASVTRGIENPEPRTCLVDLRMRVIDFCCIALFLAIGVTSFVL